MKELKGEAASPFTPDVYHPHEKDLGKQFWYILGQIASAQIDKKIFESLSSESKDPH